MNIADVISRSQPIDDYPVYAIGVKEHGVTVASQQRRAIHLIDALVQRGVIGAGSPLAVVGAGAAGLTASVRAAHAGCDVVLLDRNAELLSTFRGNDTRVLHPNLYSWPSPSWKEADAGLPLLNWHADITARVVRTIEEEFKQQARSTGLVAVELSANIDWVNSTFIAARPQLTWTTSARTATRELAAIILAVGFGQERGLSTDFPGYWENDRIQQNSRLTYFIQGAGDGGLTDLFRIRLSMFDQMTYFERTLGSGRAVDVRELEASIAEAEASPRTDEELDAFYRSLKVAWLERAIEQSGLRPNRVLLNDSRVAFGRGRFPINKLFASCLLRMDRDTHWIQGESIVKPLRKTPRALRPFKFKVLVAGERYGFDRALRRKGGRGAIDEISPVLAGGCSVMAKRGEDTGWTRPAASCPSASNEAHTAALSRAVAAYTDIASIVRVLLLSLRMRTPGSAYPWTDSIFDELWQTAYRRLGAIAVDLRFLQDAPDIRDLVCDLLQQQSAYPCDVSSRAIVEAIDNLFGARLYGGMRGHPRSDSVYEWVTNGLHPRCRDDEEPEGRADGGLATLALVPPLSGLRLRLQWARERWPSQLNVVVGSSLMSFDDLQLTTHPTGRFFGAVAKDPARLSARLKRLLRDVREQHFVVLPEFALHADLNLNASLAVPCNLFAGIGHVDDPPRRVHRRVMRLNGSPPLTLEKTEATVYRHRAVRPDCCEDIHTCEPYVVAAMSSDGAAAVVLAGPDGWSDPVLALVAQLRPRVVLNVGWSMPRHLVKRLRELRIACVGAFHTTVEAGSQVLKITKK